MNTDKIVNTIISEIDEADDHQIDIILKTTTALLSVILPEHEVFRILIDIMKKSPRAADATHTNIAYL